MVDGIMLLKEMVSVNTMTGLNEVTRNLTLFEVTEEDTVKFTCSASAYIPGTGMRTDSISFSLLVHCKYMSGYINLTIFNNPAQVSKKGLCQLLV